jgi:hypothetical protein
MFSCGLIAFDFFLHYGWYPRVGRQLLWDDSRWKEGFWWALCIAASDALATPQRGPSPSSFAVLSCLKHFAEDPDYCTHIINQVTFLLSIVVH